MTTLSNQAILELNESDYKEYMKDQKMERRRKEKEERQDIKLQAEADKIVNRHNKRIADEKAAKREKIEEFAKEKQKNYAKIQKKMSGKKSPLTIKIPHYGIKIRKAEPKPEQKSYFNPVHQSSSYFGRTRL